MKKSKHLILIIIIIGFICNNHAQSIKPESINSAASTMTNTNGTLSFTVGEIVVLTFTDSLGNTIGGGFTSASTASTTVSSIEEPNLSTLSINVFPNPTTDLLQIEIYHSSVDLLTVSINDIGGKLVYQGNYSNVTNLIGINTTDYAVGTYIMTLTNTKKEVLGTYKIIKK